MSRKSSHSKAFILRYFMEINMLRASLNHLTSSIFHSVFAQHLLPLDRCQRRPLRADLQTHAGLLQQNSLQADETPIRYQNPGKGKCSTGYLWVFHAPRHGIKGDILYQWHPSRKASSLDDLLGDYQGHLQTDAYAGYDSWTADKGGIILVACWAHARRKFHEAFKAGQTLAAAPLAAIAQIYQIETTLRQASAQATERAQVRQARSAGMPPIFDPTLMRVRVVC